MAKLSYSTVYNGLLSRFQNSPVVGTVPADGARYGIITGSAAEYARLGTAFAQQESSFNPNEGPPNPTETSYGLFQYDHSQVPGGNAYNPYASMDAFVRDVNSSVNNTGSLNAGILGGRFSQTTFNVAGRQLSGAGPLADGTMSNGVPDNAQGGTASSDQTELGMEGQGADAPSGGTGTGTGAGAGTGTGAGTGAGTSITGMGMPIQVGPQPGLTSLVQDTAKNVETAFGKGLMTALNYAWTAFVYTFGGVGNVLLRGILIVLGATIIIAALWHMMGGPSVQQQIRMVAKTA